MNWRNTEESKALQRNGLSLGSMKLKQNEEYDIQLNRSGYSELSAFEYSGHIICK